MAHWKGLIDERINTLSSGIASAQTQIDALTLQETTLETQLFGLRDSITDLSRQMQRDQQVKDVLDDLVVSGLPQ